MYSSNILTYNVNFTFPPDEFEDLITDILMLSFLMEYESEPFYHEERHYQYGLNPNRGMVACPFIIIYLHKPHKYVNIIIHLDNTENKNFKSLIITSYDQTKEKRNFVVNTENQKDILNGLQKVKKFI